MHSRRNRFSLLAILAVTAFAAFVVWPGNPDRYLPGDFWPSGQGLTIGDFDRSEMELGLDLRGGTHVVLQADTTNFDGDLDQALDSARSVIENRVNAFGVAETEITRQGSDRISVQLPGVSPEEAAELIGRTAVLEFREPRTNDAGLIAVTVPGPPPEDPIAPETAGGDDDVIEEAGDEDEETEATETPTPTPDDAATPEPTPSPEGTPEATGTTPTTPDPDLPQTHEEFVDIGQIGTTFLETDIVWETATGVIDGDLVPLSGRQLSDAAVAFDSLNQVFISLDFTGDGADLFEQITGRLAQAGQLPLGIFLDEELLTAPTVNSQIAGGEAQITRGGGFDLDEAERIVAQLDAGALPVPLDVVQQNEVDATLGEDTVVRTVEAGLIAVGVVMLFMVLYYRLPGLTAAFALLVYTSLVLLIFKIVPVTLTLAGIAAFVLSVGIAVDANILIFERMKEELRLGRRLREAIDIGWERAWPSIRDSNASTLITSVILYIFGAQFEASLVQSFAVALAIGVLVSMLTAILVTRTFLNALVDTRWATRRWLFGVSEQDRQMAVEGEQHPEIEAGHRPGGRWLDFVGHRWYSFAFSLLILVPGLISLAIPPRLNAGIEFTSGTTFTIDFESEVGQEDLRGAMADLGHPESRIQRTGDGDYLVRTEELEGSTLIPPVGPAPPTERDDIQSALQERFGEFQILDFETVSGVVSEEIGRNATIAVIAASLAILAYITFAFRSVQKPLVFGACAVIALVHDAILVLGAFSILGKLFDIEINTMFITGMLTVIGFSVHDSIVVFDRIRENVEKRPGEDLGRVVNDSLLETIARSFTTSLTVLITILAMLLLGGAAIQEFLLVLLIGVISGAYSSVFVAAQLLVAFERGDFTNWLAPFRKRRESTASTGS
ncbi:MAG: protein translocase subunit SecD [Dehalococcoidia bacterium]|nr:protein translocase subunit SecD [Dehalococcoidia bacterium]